jgi:hypothetical protein
MSREMSTTLKRVRRRRRRNIENGIDNTAKKEDCPAREGGGKGSFRGAVKEKERK